MAERLEDFNLPNAVIGRIIKDTLPDGVAVSKEARVAISKAASVFVLYATTAANGIAHKNKKKTISAMDILNAMKEMEFEKFVEPLQESLELHKKNQQSKKELKEAKAKSKKSEDSNKDSSEIQTDNRNITEDDKEVELIDE